jgi:hypothetical protein
MRWDEVGHGNMMVLLVCANIARFTTAGRTPWSKSIFRASPTNECNSQDQSDQEDQDKKTASTKMRRDMTQKNLRFHDLPIQTPIQVAAASLAEKMGKNCGAGLWLFQGFEPRPSQSRLSMINRS